VTDNLKPLYMPSNAAAVLASLKIVVLVTKVIVPESTTPPGHDAAMLVPAFTVVEYRHLFVRV
jgi:hypothetical protein